MRKLMIFAILMIIPLVYAVDEFGYDNPTIPHINPETLATVAFDNNSANVNNSNYLDGYDSSEFIKTDGTSTTTAQIPFEAGINSIGDANFGGDAYHAENKSIYFGTDEDFGMIYDAGANIFRFSHGTLGNIFTVNENTGLINVFYPINSSKNISTTKQFVSTQATGTAPMSVASTTKVTNLNCDYLDGYSTGTSAGTLCPLNSGTCQFSGTVSANTVITNSMSDPAALGSVTFNDVTGSLDFMSTGTINIGTYAGNVISFHGAAGLAQQAQTVDLKDYLISLGLYSAVAGATPLNLDGGTLTNGYTVSTNGFQSASNTLGGFSMLDSAGASRYTIHNTNISKGIVNMGQGGDDAVFVYRAPNGRVALASANVTGGQSGSAINMFCSGGSNGICNFTTNTKITTFDHNVSVGNTLKTKDLNVTGNLVVGGNLTLTDTVWDDLTFSMSNLKINPVTSKPDEDTVNIFYLFDDASTESVRGVGQSSHSQKNNTPLSCHIHWVQSAVNNVTWELNYTLNNLGQTTGETWRVLNTSVGIYTYSSGNLEQLSDFPDTINISGIGLSSIFRFRVSRLGGDSKDTMAGDAKFESFDCHYEKDSLGSTGEFTK